MQFLDSYKSVTLDSMAKSFGVGIDFIDTELADFIVAGRLTAKIDKVAGVIETNRSGHVAIDGMLRRCLWDGMGNLHQVSTGC